MQIQAFAGPADYIGAGALRPRIHDFASFVAFGYDCSHVAVGGIPTTSVDPKTYAPGDSHVICATTYFVNQRTEKLAGFTTVSRRFHTPAGVRPDDSVPDAERREHGWVQSEDPPALNERSAAIWLALDETADRRVIADLTVESARHPIGLEFV